MTKLMTEPISHGFLAPHKYCMRYFLRHHNNYPKKFCCNISLYWNHVINELALLSTVDDSQMKDFFVLKRESINILQCKKIFTFRILIISGERKRSVGCVL